MTGKEWLAWFVMQPQERCPQPYCGRWNETNPPSWWRGNCSHARATLSPGGSRE